MARKIGFKRRLLVQRLKSKFGVARCFYCGIELETTTATLDHVLPLAKGGGNSYQNLLLCCRPCNLYRGDGDFETFKARRRLMVPEPLKSQLDLMDLYGSSSRP